MKDQAGAGEINVAALFDAHAAFLLRVAWRLTGSKEAAEDIVQETFLVAHRRRADLTDGPELRGWLYRVASNLVQRHRRGSSRRDRLESAVSVEPTASTSPDPAAGLEAQDNVRAIRKAVDALPFQQREVFVLYELDELGGKEIAALLGIAEGTVWTRLHAARKSFAAMRGGK